MFCEGCDWEKPATEVQHERSPEETLSDSEAALTRFDSSDEEPLVRPVLGRNVVRVSVADDREGRVEREGEGREEGRGEGEGDGRRGGGGVGGHFGEEEKERRERRRKERAGRFTNQRWREIQSNFIHVIQFYVSFLRSNS